MLLRHLQRVLEEVVASGLGTLALEGAHAHIFESLRTVHT